MVPLNYIKKMNTPQRLKPKLKENAIPSIFRNVNLNKTGETSQYEIFPKTFTGVLYRNKHYFTYLLHKLTI